MSLSRFCGLAASLCSPAGSKAKLTILAYHRVLPAPDELTGHIDALTFERQMAFLASSFKVMTLNEAVARLLRRSLPARALCITFDDGYADNESTALSILKRVRVPATFFVASGFSGGKAMFNDVVIEAIRSARQGRYDLSSLRLGTIELGDLKSRRRAIAGLIDNLKYLATNERDELAAEIARAVGAPPARRLMMTERQIRHLHDEGMEIGAHTVSHPILAKLNEDVARDEISLSKRVLQDVTGAAVTSFAYPNGKPGLDYGVSHVRLVREEGFAAAVSTVHGIASAKSDVFQLPRFSPWEKSPARLGARIVLDCAREGALGRSLDRIVPSRHSRGARL